jgi:cholesterol oxidase
MDSDVFDAVIIGSGFGGSVSAMRLAGKGYRVLVLERGKRFRDQDFARTNWNIWRYLWLPAARCFGIFQMSFLNGLLALHGSGVGGGSLTYANVLMEPDDKLFDHPTWKHLADWKSLLRPHYDTARRMLGVTRNPRLWPADEHLRQIATDLGQGETFQPADVGVFFGEREGETVPDPFFNGEGPDRAGCTHCGGCMVGCRYNAKNTLVKNYLYFAEKWGAEIRPETTVTDIRPLPPNQPDGALYEILWRKTTAVLPGPEKRIRARKVIVSAGVLGTLELLFRCRDVTRSLPGISDQLGENVRTNSEAILGATSWDRDIDYSRGVAITSVVRADAVTAVEPVRYSDGSSLIRLLALPMIEGGGSIAGRILRTLGEIIRHPLDFLHARFFAPWARRTTILLVMQTEDNLVRMRLGRNLFTLGRRGVVIEHDVEHHIPSEIPIGNQVTREFAKRTRGVAQAAFTDSLFSFPTSAHVMGGVPFGKDAGKGVIGLDCQVHGHPGLYVVDGSIMPANPGINPSLTITALAEYAMSFVPPKNGDVQDVVVNTQTARSPQGAAAAD